MKVLILLQFPLYGGGSGTYTRMLAEKLRDLCGHEVAIVCPDERQFPEIKTYTVRMPFQAVFESHPEFRRGRKYRDLPAHDFARLYETFFHTTMRAVEEFQPDIIHVQHAFYLTWIASFLKSFYGIPFIVTAHGSDIYNTSLDNRFRVLTNQALSRAEYIICVSPHIKKWLLKVYGNHLSRKTRIIPGGIDLDAYEKPIDVGGIEKKYKLSGQALILYVGRITEVKGLRYLILAAPSIRGQVYIIGDGDTRPELEEMVARRNIPNVHFIGYMGKKKDKDLLAFYKRASVVVVPSIWDEALGLVILEAMAAETPVIASNKGGIPLAVKDGQTGLLVRAKSAKALSKAIATILNSPTLHTRLAKNARKLVFERFSWRVLVGDINKLYERAKVVRQQIPTKQPVVFFDVQDLAREQKELTQKVGYDVVVPQDEAEGLTGPDSIP